MGSFFSKLKHHPGPGHRFDDKHVSLALAVGKRASMVAGETRHGRKVQ